MTGGEVVTCPCDSCRGPEAILSARKARWLRRQDSTGQLTHVLVQAAAGRTRVRA